jgi:hypothetical protein
MRAKGNLMSDDKPWLFKKGQPGGPGRPRGARSRLQEFVLAMLEADFKQHGQQVIEEVRKRKPEIYLTAVVNLLPRQKQEIASPFADITDAELEELMEHLKALRAKTVRRLRELELGAAETIAPPIDK